MVSDTSLCFLATIAITTVSVSSKQLSLDAAMLVYVLDDQKLWLFSALKALVLRSHNVIICDCMFC
jgi:hypothetical protein